MDDKSLADYDHRGLIPGPGENEEQFLLRVEYCLGLRKTLVEKKSEELPAINFDDQEGFLREGCEEVKKVYLIDPDWVPIAISAEGLAPWHGGVTWIFQLEENSPWGALLQVRRRPWWISRNEVVAHELCHIGRMAFQELEYEEILAYWTSASSWRRWFGAVVQTKMESFWFVIALLSVLIFDFSTMIWGSYQTFLFAQWFKLLPLGMAAWGVWRLAQRMKKFSKVLKKLEDCTSNPLAFIYRLTDREINLFSGKSSAQIKEYIEQQDSLRWQAIKILK